MTCSVKHACRYSVMIMTTRSRPIPSCIHLLCFWGVICHGSCGRHNGHLNSNVVHTATVQLDEKHMRSRIHKPAATPVILRLFCLEEPCMQMNRTVRHKEENYDLTCARQFRGQLPARFNIQTFLYTGQPENLDGADFDASVVHHRCKLVQHGLLDFLVLSCKHRQHL